MALDGLVVQALGQELNTALTGCRIDKIYQPNKTQFIFVIKTKDGNKKLLLSCNSDHPGVYFTGEVYDNPATPSSLCMFFRKHLQGGRISKVKQFQSERILEIFVDSLDELGIAVSKKLVIELMGRYSNIILVQNGLDDFPEGKILDCAKRGSIDSNTKRLVLPGQPYEYPPHKEKVSYFTVLEDDYIEKTQSPVFFEPTFISNYFQGISLTVASQIVSESENTNSSPLETLKKHVLAISAGNYCPTLWLNKNNSPKDIHVLTLAIYQNLKHSSYPTTSEALDVYYLSRSSSNKLEQERLSLSRNVKSLIKKISVKKGKLANEVEDAKNSKHLRIYGELLMANLHKFQTGDKSVNLVNYYDNTTVSIPLDIKISPSKNAQNYFKKYTKSKRAVLEKGLQLEKAKNELEYLESVLTFLNMTSSSEEIQILKDELIESEFLRKEKKAIRKKKNQAPSLLSFKSSCGKTILVGKNNKENDYLTFNLASKKDLWFHAKNIPGSHVVLLLEGDSPTEEEIVQAAEIAAYFSKSANSENVPIDYTLIRNVKKLAGGKPGMVTFSENSTLYATPKDPTSTS